MRHKLITYWSKQKPIRSLWPLWGQSAPCWTNWDMTGRKTLFILPIGLTETFHLYSTPPNRITWPTSSISATCRSVLSRSALYSGISRTSTSSTGDSQSQWWAVNNDDVACLMRWLCVVVTFPQVSPRCVSFMSEGEFVFLTRPAVCSGLLWSCLVDGGSVYSKK